MNTTQTEKQRYWLEQVKSAESSGLSYKAFAEQSKINLKSLYNWKSTFLQKSMLPSTQRPAFVKVETAARQSSVSSPVSPISVQVRLPNGIELTLASLSRENLSVLLAL